MTQDFQQTISNMLTSKKEMPPSDKSQIVEVKELQSSSLAHVYQFRSCAPKTE